ncbi:MAG: ABC transporter substrate-binding protein [Chloroflexi bacterium]|nr:ABC transporter substrate-binding protein [Chloroflexota bacterium]
MNKKSLLFTFLMVAVLMLSACGPAATPTLAATQPPAPTKPPTPVPPKVLKIANTATFTTWDPVKSFSTEAAYMGNMYEQLLRINPPGSAEKFTPLLAERWESNADGTVWTFYLRPNVKFHDGEPLTADAVKMSIEAAADHGGASFIWWMLDSIEVVDDLTVKFNLTTSAPIDLIASSLYGAWIVSPKALEAAAADENYFETGIEAGTGPYMLESYKADQEIVLTRFDDYWGGWQPGQFDKVLVVIVGEAITQQQMLEGGQVDLVTRIPNENLDTFRNNPNYTVYVEPSFFNYVGFFNTLRPPLDNAMVRQALSYAIPYDDIITIAVKGLGTQSRGPVPAGVWPWSADVKQYTYDLTKARQLLADAGFPNGGFSLKLTYAAENDAEAAFAPLIKDSFAQLGVDVTIEPMLWSQQWALSKSDPANAQDMFLLLYWPTYSDAGSDNLWSMFYWTAKPFFNLSYWKNDQFMALVDEAIAKTVTDPATSQVKYIEAMNLLVDEAPGLFFFDTMAVFVIPTYIEGFKYNLNYPFTQYFFYQLRSTK